MIIAVDGYSGCGKSTLAKAVAKELNITFIDSGAMYRAVTLFAQRNKIVEQTDLLEQALSHISITFKQVNGIQTTFLNGENIEEEIRQKQVSSQVSIVAAIPAVRTFLVDQQQHLGKQESIIMDGRDIGTTVFPEADLKFFITASIEVRTNRRLAELESKGIQTSREEVAYNLQERDRIDSTRSVSPLKKATDAIEIDTSNLSKEEQLELVLHYINTKLQTRASNN